MKDIKINTKFLLTGGDEMSHYEASFEKNPTLDEFVEWILSEKNDEWGTVYDVEHKENPNEPYSFMKKIIKYKHGRIEYCCRDYRQIKNKHIQLVKMDGGWSAMDYNIKILDE